MRLHRLTPCLMTLVLLVAQGQVAAAPAPAGGPKRPFPQHESYATGTIRPNHRSQVRQDNDVRAAYGRWKTRYLVRVPGGAGTPRYRVAFGLPNTPAHDTTVSEGQGYGMLIAVTMAGHDPKAKEIFDGLWRFSRDHPSVIDKRLMAWRIPNESGAADSAFDGDADIAMALLMADAQWGSGGRVNYLAAARRVMAGIAESTIGPASNLPMLGDWVDAGGPKYNQYTPRSSDLMPLWFKQYGRAARPAKWAKVVRATDRVVVQLQAGYSPATGLLPDFIEPKSPTNHAPRPASPNFLEDTSDGAYSYNAGRDPWRIGMDGLLTGDRQSLVSVGKISRWARKATGGDPHNLKGGYELDGTPLPGSDYFTIFFAAPVGVAAMTVPSQQGWLNALYDSVRGVNEGYYEDTVALLSMLVMTGNLWVPE